MKKLLYILLFLLPTSLFSQVILTIEGQSYSGQVDIDDSQPTTLTFKNNSIAFSEEASYLINAGDGNDSYGNNNNLDGAVFTGNKFQWTGTIVNNDITPHGLFHGCNINGIIKYNYIDGAPMGIIQKSSTSMVNNSGVIAYNIIKNPNCGIPVKGISGIKIYNNTFYTERTYTQCPRALINIYKNIDNGYNSVAHDTKIYNNIFYTEHETVVISIGDLDSQSGFDCDNNVYYCVDEANHEPRFEVNSVTLDWGEWQALGYDIHSVVINPNFFNTTSLVPDERLDYGRNLTSAYNVGLSTTAVWGTIDPTTTIQNGAWQAGARIYSVTGNQPPSAAFTASATSVTVGQSVTFTDQSSGSPTSWYWTFGGLPTSNLQNPTHTFNSVGVFTVSLQATNAYGSDTETKVDYITVYAAGGTDYYVRTDGSDSNNGLSDNAGGAWRSISHAASQVPAGFHTIHVRSGTFTETNECVFALGVSIDGAGINYTRVLNRFATSHSNWQPRHGLFTFSSASLANGNQSVSNMTLDGDNLVGTLNGSTAYVGIMVYQRSNVIIHDCVIKDFWSEGIIFLGTTFNYGTPTAHLDDPPPWYATGNQVYNCTISNCTDQADSEQPGSLACLVIGSQTEMEIHDNIFTENSRSQGHNGDLIISGWWEKGIKIYNNVFTKINDDGASFNFHIEMWCTTGGFEVYNNEFYGGDCAINIAGFFNVKGEYSYSWYVHDNYFETTNTVNSENANRVAIVMEDENVEDVIVTRNHFKYFPRVAAISNGSVSTSEIRNIEFSYNLMQECGWNNSGGDYWTRMLEIGNENSSNTIDNILVANNIFQGNSIGHADAIWILPRGVTTNINIKNNIAVNCGNVAWLAVGNYGSMNGLHIDYNISYNCANSNNYTITPNDGWFFTPPFNSISNLTATGNLPGTNPGFVSSTDFHLSIDRTGVDVGLIKDFDYDDVDDPPTIGIYEYGAKSSSTPYVTTSTITDITTITATGGGNVIDDGGEAITARGICWNTDPDPTLTGHFTTNGTGEGSYISYMTGLVSGTTYYVRAYATNSNGTDYGDNVMFQAGGEVIGEGSGKIVNASGKIVKHNGHITRY